MRVAVGVFALGLSAVSAVASAETATTVGTLVPAKEKLICKRQTASASRLPGPKVCMTAKEWRHSEANARQTTLDMQRSREATHGEE